MLIVLTATIRFYQIEHVWDDVFILGKSKSSNEFNQGCAQNVPPLKNQLFIFFVGYQNKENSREHNFLIYDFLTHNLRHICFRVKNSTLIGHMGQ